MNAIAASDRLRRTDLLLAELLDLPAGKRRARLERVCAEDADLRAALEELLRLAGAPATALDRGALGGGPLLDELAREMAMPPPVEVSGSRIGPWRLVGELGRGGMGVVYEAERADGEFEQTVALKLLPADAGSDEVLRRFEQERRILASLAHPGIARLFDGGRTEDGRPFFVMEHVEGRPIDRYCDEERLTVEERLDLFLQVGAAVRHAHRRLVVHRDLKPANVLVTAEGRAKLLDFGIARLLPGDDAAAEPLTRTLARILTPEYASPEQVRGEPITTASDVYQLGLLLYELLSGRQAHRLTTGALGEIETAVCRRIPARPSTAADSDGEGRARDGGARPNPWRRRLRGDLDAIVMTALRKEPEARYPSVDALLCDVERHLAGLPILVRRSDRLYRARKYVQRNGVGLAAAAVVLLAVLGYAVAAGVQSREIARQRDLAVREADRANRVRNFLAQVLAAHGDPAALDLAAARVPELEPRPDVQAEMLRVLGEMYTGFGSMHQALPLLREAVALDRELAGEESEQALRSRASLAAALHGAGHLDEAADEYRRIADSLRRNGGGGSGQLAAIQRWRGRLAALRGEYVEAERSLREALAMRRRIDSGGVARLRSDAASAASMPPVVFPGGQPHLRLARAVRDLASLQIDRGALGEAKRLIDEGLALERLRPGYRPSLAETLHLDGRLRWAQGRPKEAEARMREALEVAARFAGQERASVSTIRLDRVRLLALLGRLEEAREQLAAAEAGLERHAGVDPSLRIAALQARAAVAAAEGDREVAIERLREAASILDSWGHGGTPRWAELQIDLGRCLAEQGRTGEAAEVLQASAEALARALPPSHRLRSRARQELARIAVPAAGPAPAAMR